MRLDRVPKKRCRHCKNLFARKRFSSGSWESPKSFMARVYCSRRCMGEDWAKAPLKKRMEDRGRYMAQKLFAAKKCQTCGKKKGLIRHHVDENPQNNSAANVKILCRKCHNHLHSAMRPRKVCMVCGKTHHSSGLCATHYYRFKMHGDPLMKRLNTRSGEATKVET